MHEYTRLKLGEMIEKFSRDFSDGRDKAAATYGRRGFEQIGGQLLADIEKIGIELLNSFIDDLFTIEKKALSSLAALPSDDYFADLEDEFIQVAQARLQNIHTRILDYLRRGRQLELLKHDFESSFERHRAGYAGSIKRNIAILKEELQMDKKSSGETTIHIRGDVGVLNTGTVYGNVHGHIEKMRGVSGAEIADIFDKVLTAIKDSHLREEEQIEQMQNLEFLIDQHQNPPEKRNKGLISAAIKFLSAAANLTTIWEQFGPAIKAALQIS